MNQSQSSILWYIKKSRLRTLLSDLWCSEIVYCVQMMAHLRVFSCSLLTCRNYYLCSKFCSEIIYCVRMMAHLLVFSCSLLRFRNCLLCPDDGSFACVFLLTPHLSQLLLCSVSVLSRAGQLPDWPAAAQATAPASRNTELQSVVCRPD